MTADDGIGFTNPSPRPMIDSQMSEIADLPVLYSFRRCPYAIRARMALRAAEITVTLREVDLGNRPDEMLFHSPKGSVPVLVFPDDQVIDESLDIMKWALGRMTQRDGSR